MAPVDGLSKTSQKLIPSDPSTVMVIRDISPNLTTLSVPFLRFGRLRIGGRATIVRLQSGALAVFSPVALTPAVEEKLASYGNNVRYLAALDIEHHIFLGPWAKKFPGAEIIGMDGLPEKREKDPDTKGLKFDHVFTPENKLGYKIGGEFDREFEYEYVNAHGNKELVFYHRPTQTMIEADLLFNLPATEQYSKCPSEAPKLNSGVMQRVFNTVMSAKGDAIWQRRFLWYLVAGKDRKGMTDSLTRMDKWDVQRIIPCHGDVMEGQEAKGVWGTVFEWFREGKKTS